MGGTIRIAAAGDIHCSEPLRDRIVGAFAELRGTVDLILLAGDLTTHGEPEQAAVLADAVRDLGIPVVAVLGNHDYHANRCDELGEGFVGGFPGAELPDFGEPLLREVYRETTRDVDAIEAGLESIAGCHRRIVLLHYAPVPETLVGEPETIWAFLGSSRLAAPIGAHRPDLVLHGHAHRGSFTGAIGEVPVHNVAVHVTGQEFAFFEL
jgi:Icc-related predicted phosphoesterase